MQDKSICKSTIKKLISKSPEMAIRLSKAFGGSAESWLIQQAQYDLWQANHKGTEFKVKSFIPTSPEFSY